MTDAGPQGGTAAAMTGVAAHAPRRAPLVIKLGGSTLAAQAGMLADVAGLARDGEAIVVVHGGGAAVSAWMERLGLQPRFNNGLRVTDPATLEVVRMVLAGTINQELVAVAAGLGVRAVGLTGLDGGGLLQAKRLTSGGDIGLVGEITEVRHEVVTTLLDAGYLPVVAPLGRAADAVVDDGSAMYNINADVAAGAIARALGARAAVFLTDVPGVRGADGTILPHLSAAEAEALIAEGVVHGGMIPKVRACLAALRGARSAVILDGRVAHSLRAWATDGSAGTVIES
ncbi:MAG: acetylglutamate kinase [Chloroflexota bacterium]